MLLAKMKWNEDLSRSLSERLIAYGDWTSYILDLFENEDDETYYISNKFVSYLMDDKSVDWVKVDDETSCVHYMYSTCQQHVGSVRYVYIPDLFLGDHKSTDCHYRCVAIDGCWFWEIDLFTILNIDSFCRMLNDCRTVLGTVLIGCSGRLDCSFKGISYVFSERTDCDYFLWIDKGCDVLI